VKAKSAHFAPNFFDMRKIGAMRQIEKFNAQSTQKAPKWQLWCKNHFFLTFLFKE
jgi:nitrate reductase gamma subunit